MQAIEAATIDEIFTAMKEYEKANFGLKGGAEFPQVAQALINSTKFRELVSSASLMGMISTMMLPRDKEGRDKLIGDKEGMDKMLQDTPLRDILAEVFAGFKVGRVSAEVAQLEKLAR
jgi:hypothetical protein